MRQRCLVLALLAALAVAGGAGEAVGAGKGHRASPPRLKAFGSCVGLVHYARRNGVRLVRDRAAGLPRGGPVPVGGEGGGEDGTGGPVPVAPPPAPAPGDQTSPTNVQEAGVDEPDIVKADGSTVYTIVDDQLHALDAGVTPPRVLGSLALRGFGGELLVRGDRALVMSNAPGPPPGPGPVPVSDPVAKISLPPSEWGSRSVLTEVDISDPSAMRVVRTLDVEGRYLSARLTGATARVVVSSSPRALDFPTVSGPVGTGELARRWQRSVKRARAARWLPSSVLQSRRTGRRFQRALVPCRDVRRAAHFSGLDMITVLTVDLDKGLFGVDRDTVMTSGETVYASPRSLYVATERWLGEDPSLRQVENLSVTALHKFDAAKPGETAYRASGEVPGYLINQWALSEQDGVLRVASTDRPPWWSDGRQRDSESAVRTYAERDGRLAELGRVGGLGRGERIFAVRFIGDVGFVVTFRQTDPLYAVDVSDPAAPKLLGELKVPGYSAYLHPVGDDLVLGVGRDAGAQGQVRGVQVSLFDISDLRNPVRVGEPQTVGGEWSESEVEQDHHAFLWWQPEHLAVIPVTNYGSGGGAEQEWLGAYGFRVDREHGIQLRGALTHRTASYGAGIRRALVIGDRLVTVSPAGVMSTALATFSGGDFTPFPKAPSR